jgi:TetR/AcrR family transcriptional regulator, cholesterol catabolism regulator
MARERATDTAALVAAAAAAFRSKGYRSATIDDIAEAASISRPTIYKYARSKQHLLELMVEEVAGGMTERLAAVMKADDPPETRLRRMIEVHIASASADRVFYAIVFSEEIELPEAGRAAFRSWARARTQDFAALLAECLPADSPVSTTIAANLVLSMLATLFRWYDPEGPVGPDELSRQIEALLAALFPG